ncbi:MAG: C-20 methyltransferase BchU [Chlorobiaceae bacterium]|nr:C-20 methyltransferase BchU [Chlorobiaceae bacterium]
MNSNELLRQSHRANQIIFQGVVELGCLKAALELDLFTHLSGEPKSLEAIASDVAAVPPRLVMLLESLRQIGMTTHEDGKWGITDFTRNMFLGNPENENLCMVPVVKAMTHLADNFYLNMADAVRGNLNFKGEVPYPPVTKEDNWYFEEIHRSNAHFAIKLLLEEAKLDTAKTLVDVGGGIGDISAAILKKFTGLRSTILNLPGAVELVNENAAAKGVADRLQGAPVDIYRDVYPQADAVMFCRILYSANAQLTEMMCRKAWDALPAGGKVIILDMIIDDPVNPNYDYLSHYILGAGMPFSVLGFKPQEAYKGILESIGFGNVRIVRKYDHLFCEAVKPA